MYQVYYYCQYLRVVLDTTYLVYRVAFFALHPTASPCFFMQILNESFDASNIGIVSGTYILFIGFVPNWIPRSISDINTRIYTRRSSLPPPPDAPIGE